MEQKTKENEKDLNGKKDGINTNKVPGAHESEDNEFDADKADGNEKDNKVKKIKEISRDELEGEYRQLLHENKKLLKENGKLKEFSEEKEKESLDYLDRYRRTLADVENIRKRAQTEKQDFAKYANFKIIEDLLSILDDFQRAIDSAKAGNIDFENYQQGIELIEKQFLDLLFKKYGVVKFGKKDEEFDPNKHQGMMVEEGDFKQEVVSELFRSGYSLHDRIIRPAQVKVGKPKEKKTETKDK